MDATRVLVIEDDADIRRLLRELLEDEGRFRVATAKNGLEALKALGEIEKPHVILLDLQMPELDAAGFRAIQESDQAIADIPVIVMSADWAVEWKSLKLGLNKFIRKPIDFEKLLGLIDEVHLAKPIYGDV